MNDYKKEVGLRLRQIREIMNEGSKLSSIQFGYLLDENGDKIRNYEIGRASIPIRLLYNLYKRGINPNYIITGLESIFADNEEGKRLAKLTYQRNTKLEIEIKLKNVESKYTNDDNDLKVAAGRIKK